MKKMRIDLGALEVESFATGDSHAHGTVNGMATQYEICRQFASDSVNALGCDPAPTDENTNCLYFTCNATCGNNNTCAQTCGQSCYLGRDHFTLCTEETM